MEAVLRTGSLQRRSSSRAGRPGPLEVPCALVRSHGPFCWGEGPEEAVENAVTLEEVARVALLTTALEPDAPGLDAALREKHHERKHGPGAYYGQP